MTKPRLPAGVLHLATDTESPRGVVVPLFVPLLVLAVAAIWTVLSHPGGGSGATGFRLGTVTVSGYIPAAISALDREREQLKRERDALDQFASEVESITVPAGTTSTATPVGVGAVNVDANERELRTVRNAYRTTVMAVDHYEAQYGEELLENMRLELSADVATAIVDGKRFSPPLKRTVIHQSLVARSRRESLLRTIDDERDSLEHARRRIREIESTADELDPSTAPLTELFQYERRLRRRESRYDRLLAERQQRIHADSGVGSVSGRSFLQSYLYASLEVGFPVLATVLGRYADLQKRRRAVHEAITYR